MNSANIIQALPEIIVMIAASALLIIDLFLPAKKRGLTFVFALCILAVCAVVSAYLLIHQETALYTFNGLFIADPMSHVLKLFTYVVLGFTLVYSRRYIQERGMVSGHLGGEFYILALFAMLGQMVMISGANLLVIYLGVELLSLALYALIALRRKHAVSTETAMKYFILGALASGFMLYGMSMLYGATGTLDIAEMAQAIAGGESRTILVFGVVFLVSGLAFKLGVVPFHMWVPDVYQGAPTSVALLIGGAPKLAAFAILMRLLVEGLQPLAVDWQQMLIVLSVMSIMVGNVAAIAQKNIKRMLAFSTIAQMGFMLLGFLAGAGTEDMTLAVSANSASMFYTITYVITVLGVFGVMMMMSRAGFEADELADFKGLNKRHPVAALIMMLLMFSLAGIPPLVGFYAKFTVLQAVVQAGFIWLAVLAVIFSLIGAFYYLRVIKIMYFDAPEEEVEIQMSGDMKGALSANALTVLLLGIFPGALMALCAKVMVVTLLL